MRSERDAPAVAFLCHPYHRGGVTRWMADACLGAAERGWSSWFVTVRPQRPFASGRGRPSMTELLGAGPGGARVFAPRVGDAFEFGTIRYRAHVYARAVADAVPVGVPVIVSDDPAAWLAASWLADRNPPVGVSHGCDIEYEHLVRRHGHRFAGLVGVSRRITSRLRHLASGPTEVRTIPCGIRLPDAAALRRPAESGTMRLAWVGRMEEAQKRVSDLPRIAAALRGRGASFELQLVGDGPARQALERGIEAAGLAEQVRVRGWLSAREAAEVLATADALLLPSNSEGMSLVVMEALAAGAGVVASRVSGVEDYEEHPLAASCLRLHPVGDVDAAAEALLELTRVPRAVRERDARRLAAEEFSLDRCLERYRELCEVLGARYPAAGEWRPGAGTHLSLVSLPLSFVRAIRVRGWRGALGRAGTGSRTTAGAEAT